MAAKNTYRNICRSFYWRGRYTDSHRHARTCPDCNQNKKLGRTPNAPMKLFHAGEPGERVHMDILGPFSKSSSGNRVVLMVQDQFTKWVECFPLPDQCADTVAQAFVDWFTSRFGSPEELHTDRGRNFISNLVKSLAEMLQTTKTFTTRYRPQSNGQIERMNRVLVNSIRCLRAKNIKDWDRYVY